jgi:hypothetical protein
MKNLKINKTKRYNRGDGLGILLLLFVCAIIFFILGANFASSVYEQAAVDRDFAEYVIIKGEKELEFKWKEKENEN